MCYGNPNRVISLPRLESQKASGELTRFWNHLFGHRKLNKVSVVQNENLSSKFLSDITVKHCAF